MHLVGNNSSMQPTQLWSVGNLLFFMMCIYKHCFPPMLTCFCYKCCTKMPCLLPHNHYCCLLSSPICLPHLLISVHASSLHPLLAHHHHHLCYVDVYYCVFFYIWYYRLCYISLWLHFGLFVYIFLSVLPLFWVVFWAVFTIYCKEKKKLYPRTKYSFNLPKEFCFSCRPT